MKTLAFNFRFLHVCALLCLLSSASGCGVVSGVDERIPREEEIRAEYPLFDIPNAQIRGIWADDDRSARVFEVSMSGTNALGKAVSMLATDGWAISHAHERVVASRVYDYSPSSNFQTGRAITHILMTAGSNSHVVLVAAIMRPVDRDIRSLLQTRYAGYITNSLWNRLVNLKRGGQAAGIASPDSSI